MHSPGRFRDQGSISWHNLQSPQLLATVAEMLSKKKNDREFDIVILGATGYVGHRLVSELEKLARISGLRLLGTARSPQKIQKLRDTFPLVQIEHLDITVPQEVDQIVAKTQLVVNCIGPFDLHGENVVSACARLGTHYLDITGEIIFARRMIEKYDSIAKKNNAMIVPFAGFDSVPSDIGVLLIGQEMSETHAQAVISVDLVFKAQGGLNGGTAATALDTGSKILKKDLTNHNFLIPQKSELRYDELYRPRYIAYLRRWVAPFFMEPINNKVVYRSLALAHEESKYFSPDFRYRESLQVPGGLMGATVIALLLGGSQLFLKTRIGRRIASLVLPNPGDGPSEKQMTEGFFEATVIATGTNGKVLARKMRADGDPGNVSTVKLLIACIRVMMNDEFKPKGGLLTPATAFGVRLLPALRESGVEWI